MGVVKFGAARERLILPVASHGVEAGKRRFDRRRRGTIALLIDFSRHCKVATPGFVKQRAQGSRRLSEFRLHRIEMSLMCRHWVRSCASGKGERRGLRRN